MGAHFRFRSDSKALLDVVDMAYAGLPAHLFAREGPELEVELRLLPGDVDVGDTLVAEEPPSVRTRLGERIVYGVMDARNYVLVSPQVRRARVVASDRMLDRPYHLRYELIEFAVFLLAARCQGLVPLHAACLGRDGRGVLVLGASGAGKSTLALHALAAGLELLSEDAVFVHPVGMVATGIANYLHVHADALERIDDEATRAWIESSPVIRRRSGVRKHEADLRRAPAPLRTAATPLRLVATVILSTEPAEDPAALLEPMPGRDALAFLDTDQDYARTQPGWDLFARWIASSPVYRLRRGRHPGDSVDAVRPLLD
ncbi:serine kinase [Luteimonas sp. 8-5]|uniref:serine kinase n=1 Tax=Luteimonas sp. 8-5 TaxID=3039387 RepID=UPI0024374006|nr:serine kinase [Luteimonas sp. 8-5]